MKLAVLGQALSVPSQEVNHLPSEAPYTQTAPKITKTLPRSASEKPCWGGVDEVERRVPKSYLQPGARM